MSKKRVFIVSWLIIVLVAVSGCAPTAAAGQSIKNATEPAPTNHAATPGRLILATTTSTQDSGLLEYLLPGFKEEFNAQVDVIAVGTGQALQLGKDGNADVLLVHARALEDAFMADGHGARREDVMYNDFVIVGPGADPAGIMGMTSAVDAFKQLDEAGKEGKATFISRGDGSGTHSKELSIWKLAGITPESSWYISAGQGMGEVLTMADEQQAYTLSDRATFLARVKNGLGLTVMVEKDQSLLNPYSVITVNPAKGPQINTDLANQFVEWLVSVPVQEKIEAFGKEEFGQPLFVPDSAAWRAR